MQAARCAIVNIVCFGRLDEARKAGEIMEDQLPAFTVGGPAARIQGMINNPAHDGRWLADLHSAGLPQ